MSEENDLSAIAWPGFVDILSAVIIMFVFFVMIIATALYFHIIIFKSQITAAQESAQVKIDSDVDDVIAQVQTEFAASDEQDLTIKSEEKMMMIFFGRDSISLLQNNQEQVKDYINNYIDTKGSSTTRVQISAVKNPNTLQTAARKIALARMLNVRNALLQGGFPSESIKATVVDGEPVDESYHWVKIEIID